MVAQHHKARWGRDRSLRHGDPSAGRGRRRRQAAVQSRHLSHKPSQSPVSFGEPDLQQRAEKVSSREYFDCANAASIRLSMLGRSAQKVTVSALSCDGKMTSRLRGHSWRRVAFFFRTRLRVCPLVRFDGWCVHPQDRPVFSLFSLKLLEEASLQAGRLGTCTNGERTYVQPGSNHSHIAWNLDPANRRREEDF